MSKRRDMFTQLVGAFMDLNPDATEFFARAIVAKVPKGQWQDTLTQWKGQAALVKRGQQVLPLDQPRKAAGKAPESPAKPLKEVKKPYTVLLPPSMLAALSERAAVDGSSVSHHIRAAIAGYLKGGIK